MDKSQKSFIAVERAKAKRNAEEKARSEKELKHMERLAFETKRALHRAENTMREVIRNATQLPPEFIEDLIRRSLYEISRKYGEPLEPIFEEFLRRVVIRFVDDREPTITIDNDYDHGSAVARQITVKVPEIRFSLLLDDGYLRSVSGGRGPFIMDDRTIRIYQPKGIDLIYDTSAESAAEDVSLNIDEF